MGSRGPGFSYTNKELRGMDAATQSCLLGLAQAQIEEREALGTKAASIRDLDERNLSEVVAAMELAELQRTVSVLSPIVSQAEYENYLQKEADRELEIGE